MLKNVSKWFYVAMGLGVALVGAIVAIVVLSTKPAGLTDTPTTPVDGGQTGVYYYDVAGGEVLLSFHSGNKFTITGPQLNKSGDYTVNGDAVSLDFVREEDGISAGKLAGDTLVLEWNGATVTFLKKVTYNVAFDTDGGSEIPNASVINGKNLPVPAVPVKDGYMFIGWYADNSFTTAYDFETTPVKADLTIYARWASTVIGQSEYTVDFDLGYEGAETLSAMATVGGKLYNVPTPQREGYDFAGWFISMYEDGQKLSYAYTEDMVFDAHTTLFAVWSEKDGDKLAAPAVTVSNTAIKWSAIHGASGYTVLITDSQGNELYNNREASTSKSFDFGALPAGDYRIEVVATAPNAQKNSEPAVRYFKNKALPRVSVFHVVDGVLIFNAVEGAEKYLITIDCGDETHNHTAFDNGSSTSFNFINCKMQPGGIRIVVTAVAPGMASSDSETFIYERTLAAVSGIAYDAERDMFVWTPVENAAGYDVTITANGETVILPRSNQTNVSMAGYTGQLTISVVPVTEGYNSPEAATASYSKTAPITPSGIQTNGMTIRWNAVEGATAYEVKIGEKTYTVTTNEIDLSKENTGLSAGNSYTVMVKTIAGDKSSLFSEPVAIGYYLMRDDLRYANKTVYWSGVLGVSNYEVRINGGAPMLVKNSTCCAIAFTKPGKNMIEVRYVDAGESPWVSLEVYAFTVTYQSRSISGGERSELVAIGDPLSLPTDFSNPGYEFSGWYNSPSASAGNGKKIQEAIFTGNADLVLYADWTPKAYKIQLQVDGYDVTNLTQGEEWEVTYTQYFTLPIPVSSNEVYNSFIGWFTGPAGAGDRLTDEHGKSLVSYGYTCDTTAFPFFDAGVLAFVEKSDGTYAVKAGQNFDSVSYVTVPYEHNGKSVTSILENAFANRKNVITIQIPDTIELVGVGAFTGTVKLTDINVYKVESNNGPIYYSSYNGAMQRHDSGTVYLYAFPRGKTGTYEVSADVDVILGKVFQYASIDKVIIGNGVTKINEDAFYKCEKLTAVEFRGGRQAALTLENEIFYLCKNIATIRFPAKLNTFDLNMLRNLPNLQTIEVEDGGSYYGAVNGMLTNAGKNTLLYCPTTVSGEFTVPRGIQHIGDSALANCSKITAVVIPNYVKSIGNNAFANCSGIKTVGIDGKRNNELTIGDYSFAYCGELTTVTFGGTGTDSVQGGAIRIGAFAFAPAADEAKLRNVVFEQGTNVALIGASAFAGQTELYNLSFADKMTVSAIGDSAFQGCTALPSICIPASTSSIGASAFIGCTGILTVTFEEGGEEVSFGSGAFANCTKITTVYLPTTVKVFRSGVFSGCPELTGVVVAEGNPYFTSENGVLYDYNKTKLLFYPKALAADPAALAKLPWDTITQIDDSVFSNNQKITSFVIPKGLTVIGDNAFSGCANLTSVSYEQGGTSLQIGTGAFRNCFSLTDVQLPPYITEITRCLFESCNLASFEIPASVTSIGDFAFYANQRLTAITIPAAVSYIGSGAFCDCIMLSDFTVVEDGALFNLGSSDIGVFYGCTSLTTLDLKNRASSIGANAFAFSGIVSLEIGSNVTSIGEGAFKDTVISEIMIPATVCHIGAEAFSSANIKNITFVLGGKDPLHIGSGAFKNASITSITLPARTVELYAMISDGMSGGISFPDISTQFEGCSKLKAIHVEAGGNVFTSVDGVLYETDQNGIPVTLLFCPVKNEGRLDKNGKPTYEIVVPKTVTLVVNSAFRYITELKTVSFEEFDLNDENYGKPLLEIGCGTIDQTTKNSNHVFGGAAKSKLANIRFPSHLKKIGTYAIGSGKNAATLNITFNPAAKDVVIGKYAFSGTAIHMLALPGISEIAANAFTGLGSANAKGVNVTFSFGEGSTLTNIPTSAFSNTRVSEVIFPASVQMISSNAFATNSNIVRISFEEGSALISVGAKAFSSCSNLATFELTNVNGLQNLGNSAFEGCKLLTSFHLKESLLSIGKNCFKGAVSIQTVYISKNTTPAMLFGGEGSALANMTGLANIVVDADNKDFVVIDGVLYDRAQTVVYHFPAGLSIEGYQIPNTVKIIENGAFYGFAGTTIHFPESLEKIGDSAFYGSSLTHIEIPAGVTSIGIAAFSKSAELKTVIYASNSKLQSIGDSAFSACTALEATVLPDGVEYIGASAFENCDSLTEVILPAALTEIKTATFRSCDALTSVMIQQQVTAIGDSAFEGCAIRSIEIPAAVTTIGNFAFYQADKLTAVVFTEGSRLDSLGDQVFAYASALQAVDIPADVQSIGQMLFLECTSLVRVSLPDMLTSIPASSFEGCVNLETVNIPLAATEIGEKAFYQNKKLTAVTIPAGVATIGNSAFEGCASMTSLIFADGSVITALGTSEKGNDNIFKGTRSLGQVTLPESLTFIGAHVFEGSGIKDFAIPATVTCIGDYAFYDCDGITAIDIFANVTYLGDYAFYDCDGLETATVSFGLEYFGAMAFGSCDRLSGEGYIPASVVKIGANPYAGSSGVRKINLDADSETYMLNEQGMLLDIFGQVLYYYPANITDETAIIPESIIEVVSGAFAGASMKHVVFPAKFGEIQPYLFMNCDNLETVVIEEGITSIGAYAFMDCDALISVSIPNTVTAMLTSDGGKDTTPTTIGNYAFADCDSVTTVTFADTVRELPYVLGTHIFENCAAMTVVTLPNYSYLSQDDRDAMGVYGISDEEFKYGCIPSYMFAGAGIVHAVIPENYTYLDSVGVFMNCKQLATLTFGADVLAGNTIGSYYFYGCSAIKEIDIPAGMLSAFSGDAGYQFAYCTALEKFTLKYYPNLFGTGSATQSGHTFEGCVSLKEFHYLKIVEDEGSTEESPSYTYEERYLSQVGPYFFAGCTSLESFTVANGATIGEYAFDGCTALSAFMIDPFEEEEGGTLPIIPILPFSTGRDAGTESSVAYETEEPAALYLTALGSYAFRGCTALTDFTLVSVKESVGYAVFDGWQTTQTITIEHTKDDMMQTEAFLNAGVFASCGAKIIGNDGKQIYVDSETGARLP